MKLDARMLTFADPFMTGPDVDRLHEELSQLRDPYQKLVLADVDPDGRHRFGENTKKAVAAFQEKYRERLQAITVRSLDGREDVRWSGEWGVVDPATAQVINEVVQSLTVPFVIRGRVELEDGTPLPGARVVAFDRDIGSVREELGKKDGAYVTNANGGFPDIQYSVEAYAGGEGKHGASADLVFEVTGLEKPDAFELVAIYRTIPWPGRAKEERVADLVRGFRALPVETVRLVVRRRGELNPSEYERLMAALKPLLIGEITPARFDEDQHRDYSFAADETVCHEH
ncbi:MAG: carboxypeptidase-like regulatory domain-containing protein [Gemmatimonadaceae bacterium]